MRRLLMMIATLLLTTLTSYAQTTPDRRLGGCSTDGLLCAGPTASMSVVQMNLSDDTIQTGLIPGVGYGVTYWSNEWYNTGLALFMEVVTGDGPNVVQPAVVFSFAEYLRLGVAFQRTSGVSGVDPETDTIFLFGLGADLGTTPGLGIVK